MKTTTVHNDDGSTYTSTDWDENDGAPIDPALADEWRAVENQRAEVIDRAGRGACVEYVTSNVLPARPTVETLDTVYVVTDRHAVVVAATVYEFADYLVEDPEDPARQVTVRRAHYAGTEYQPVLTAGSAAELARRIVTVRPGGSVRAAIRHARRVVPPSARCRGGDGRRAQRGDAAARRTLVLIPPGDHALGERLCLSGSTIALVGTRSPVDPDARPCLLVGRIVLVKGGDLVLMGMTVARASGEAAS